MNSKTNRSRSPVRSLLTAGVLAILASTRSFALADDGAAGAVYALNNQTDNAVLVYARAADGTLTLLDTVSTGGSGAGTGGDPLGSQDALTLASGYLFAVNAGSNEISMFAITDQGLTLVDKEPSGGTKPVSVAVNGTHVYVLNAGGTPNISGFDIDPWRHVLLAKANSQRPLVGGVAANPADVRFNAEGDVLVVTEKGTSTIDTYLVDGWGYASQPTGYPATASTPFGFAITPTGKLLVVNAGAAAASSYKLGGKGVLTPDTAELVLNQKAPCWLVATSDGRYAFTANAGGGTISALAVSASGSLSIINATAASLAAPLDMALSRGGEFLYAREGNGSIAGYRVGADGSLVALPVTTGLPAGAQGIAAR